MAGSLIKYSSEQQFVEELKKHGRVVSLREMHERDSPQRHIVVGTVKYVYKFVSNPARKSIKLILQEGGTNKRRKKFFFGFVLHEFATELKRVDLKPGDHIAFRSGYVENTRFEVIPPDIQDLQIVIGFHSKYEERVFVMKKTEHAVSRKNVRIGRNVHISVPAVWCYSTILRTNYSRTTHLNKRIRGKDAVNKAGEYLCVDLTGNESQREENSGDSDCEIIYTSVKGMNATPENLQQDMANTSPLPPSSKQLRNNPPMKRFPLTEERTENVEQSAEENNLRTRSGIDGQEQGGSVVQSPPVSDVEMSSCVANFDSGSDYVDTDLSDFIGSLSDVSLRNRTSSQECPSMSVDEQQDAFTGNPKSCDTEVNAVTREEIVESSSSQMGKRQSTEVYSGVSKLRKTDSQSNQPSVLENYMDSANKCGNNFQDDPVVVERSSRDSRCDDVDTDFSGSLSPISLRNITSCQECSVNWLPVNMLCPHSPTSVDAFAGTSGNPKSSDIEVNNNDTATREESVDSASKQIGKRQSTEVDSKVSKLRKTDNQRNQPSVLQNCADCAHKYGNNFHDDPKEKEIFFACMFATLESDESALPQNCMN